MNKRMLHTMVLSLLATGAGAQVNTYAVGQTVDDFTVTDTQGNVHNLYSITASGKYVMLDFFFATCPPCQQTQPFFNQLHETYGCNAHDLFLMSINEGVDDNATVITYENTYGGTYAHSPAVAIEGGCTPVRAAFGITAYPTYCLIGPDNKLVNGDIWPVSSMQSYVNAFPSGGHIQPAPCVTGIGEIAPSAAVRLFPMPSNGPLTVEMDLASAGSVELELVDAVGRTVRTEVLGRRAAGALTHRTDLSGLADGHYALRIRCDGSPAAVRHLMVAH